MFYIIQLHVVVISIQLKNLRNLQGVAISLHDAPYFINFIFLNSSYEGKISHNLVNFLHPKIKALLPASELSSR